MLDLAEILETTVDSLLRGGEVHIPFSGKLSVENILEGINPSLLFPASSAGTTHCTRG